MDTWTHPTTGSWIMCMCMNWHMDVRRALPVATTVDSFWVVLHFIMLSASPEQDASSPCSAQAALSQWGNFLFSLSLPGLGAVSILPTYSTHLCLLHTLTTDVFSTLHQAGFEAHDILRNPPPCWKISQMLVDRPLPWALVSMGEQDDGEEVTPVPLTSVFPGLLILSSVLEKLKPGPGLPCSESFCGCEQSQPLFLVSTLAYDSLHHVFSSHPVLFIVNMSL